MRRRQVEISGAMTTGDAGAHAASLKRRSEGMTSERMRSRWKVSALMMVALLGGALMTSSCGDEAQPMKSLQVRLYGWGPDEQGGESFVEGLPAYEGATSVRAKVTRPASNRIVGSQTRPILDRKVQLPQLPYERGLRLELEVLDAAGEAVASGATPVFDFGASTASRALRVMVMPLNRFAPAGSIELDESGQRKFVQSRFDYRVESYYGQTGVRPAVYLGRVGHVAVPTSDGKVLIVGGADVIPGSAPGTIPKFRQVHTDVQLFDPETGYFSDLSLNEATQTPFPDRADRLEDGRAFHTVTPIGEDKFLVIGGYTEAAGQSRPVRTVELIDLKAQPGFRVKPLTNLQGAPLELNSPRGFHTAIHRPQSDQVIVIGGVGLTSEQILSSIEIINLETLQVLGQTFELGEARTEHTSVLLGDGSVWVLGGRNSAGVLASTEIIEFGALSVSVKPESDMNEPRFGFGTVVIRDVLSTQVVVIGGFTSLTGEVTATYEIGIKGRQFVSGLMWRLAAGRGALSAVELPQSRDVLVIGGQDKDRGTISSVERLVYQGLAAGTPYRVVSEGMGAFRAARLGASVTMMTSGQLLVTGGVGTSQGTVVALDNAELYNPYDPVGGSLTLP